MKLLLTGAAGFIGAAVTRQAVAAGYDVAAVIRPTTNTRRLGGLHESIRVIRRDLTQLAAIKQELTGWAPDVCLHLAWAGWPGDPRNLSSLAVGAELVRHLGAMQCPRLVLVGSCFEADPSDVYGVCKRALADVAAGSARQTGVEVVAPKVFGVYGPGESARRLVPSVILALLRGESVQLTPGHQVRDFLHVDDVAAGLLTLARSTVTGQVNICSGRPVSVGDVARQIAHILDRTTGLEFGALPYRPSEPMYLTGDPSVLRGLWWRPRYNLTAGLEATIDWWRTAA